MTWKSGSASLIQRFRKSDVYADLRSPVGPLAVLLHPGLKLLGRLVEEMKHTAIVDRIWQEDDILPRGGTMLGKAADGM